MQDTPAKLEGLTPPEIIQRIQHIFPEPDQAINHIQTLVAQGVPVKGEEITLNDGRTLMRDFIPIFVDGKRHGRLWLHNDITERKRAEEILRESEEKYRNLFNHAEVGMFRTKLDGSEILDFNDKFLKIFDRTREEVKGNPSVIHWANPHEREEMVRRLKSDGHITDFECRMLTAQGEERTCLASVKLYPGSAALEGSIIDITESKKTKKALLESEERFRTVADFTYDWEYWVDAEGNFLYCSPSCERITGYSAEDFIGNPDLMNRIIHPDDRAKILEHYHNVRKVAPHAVETKDFRIIRRNSEKRWISHVCQPVYNKEGRLSGRRGSNRDITVRKQVEESLKISEERYRHISTLTSDIAYSCSKPAYDAYSIDWMAGATERILGYSVDHIKALKCWRNLVFDEDLPIFDRHVMGLTPGTSASCELRVRHKDGRIVWVSSFAECVLKSGSLDGLRLYGGLVDITERKRAEESEKRLFKAIEQAAEAIIITGATGIIEYVNPAQEILSGYTRDELVGRTPNIFKSVFHDGDFYKQLWETIKAGNVWSGRFVNQKKDGTIYHQDATISPVYDKTGKLINFVAAAHDVTKQLELQEQLFQAQKMEAIGTLAGGFAHDFNNKLQVIHGYVDLILFSKDLPETIKHDLGIIKQAINGSSELIRGMMVFSRKKSVKLEPLNLNDIVAQLGSILTPVMPKTIAIDLVVADDLWTINASASQIDQILMNLAVNARDAMPDGGKLTIKTQNITLDEEFLRPYPHTKPGRYVLLSVTDSGTGMEKETIKHIFEPFFTTKESNKGTGLGLSTVYGIVEKHGGLIICDSEPSVGTTFRIYFAASEEVPENQYFEKTEPPRGRGETLLLIDDEPDFLETTSRLLNRANYRVIAASSGEEALILYEKHRGEIRLVILDLIMVTMRGEECLRSLLKMDPKVRALMIGGALKQGMAEDLKKAGAKGLVKKPFVLCEGR
ncbi:MAG: PAS domain S-box protein [Desulfomonilaceae bacterium]